MLTLQGAGCTVGDPSLSCGSPTAVSFLGGAVQAESMYPVLKVPGTMLLKLRYDEPP